MKRRRDDDETESDDTDDDEAGGDDVSSVDGCINIIKRVKEANGTLTHEFQRSVKRLRRFNGRRLERHARKKLRSTMALTPKEVKTWKSQTIRPKSADVTQKLGTDDEPSKENLLTEQVDDQVDPKDVIEDMTKPESPKKDTFMDDMDKFEAEIAGTNDSKVNHDDKNHETRQVPQQGDEEKGVFHFNPNITFGGSDNGKNLFNTSACMTESVSRDRECPGLKSEQFVPATLANLFTGKLKTRESLYYYSKLNETNKLCNLFFISCRVNFSTWAETNCDPSRRKSYNKHTSVY